MYKAREAKMADIFDSGLYAELIIPAYQRSYVWSNDEFESYWEDFITSSDSQSTLKLIGPLILGKSKADAKLFQIVDGQQRLITTSLLLAAVRDVWGEEIGIDDDYYDIHRYIVTKNRQKGLVLKIKVAGNIAESYTSVIAYKSIPDVAANDDAKAIVTAYRYFKDKVKNYVAKPGLHEKEKRALLDRLLESVFDINCILVVLDNEDDAYEVFEGFNARGVDLSISDLFKNLILSKVKGDPAVQQEALEKWHEISQVIKEINVPKFSIDTFLRYYWVGKHKYITERELYKSIKTNTKDYNGLLSELHHIAQTLKVLFSRDPWLIKDTLKAETRDVKYANNINDSLLALRAMNTQSYMVWLMALVAKKNMPLVEIKWFAKSLHDVEAFSFRYFGVSKQPANKIEKEFAKLARELYKIVGEDNKASVPTVVVEGWKLAVHNNQLLPSEDQFLEDFQAINLQGNNKPFIRYLLSTVENHLATEEKKVDQITVNIEHILPQRPDVSWHIKGSELKDNVNRLGNITIVLEKFNSSMSNKPIIEKIGLLSKSSLEINKQIVNMVQENNHSWDADAIGTRQQELAAYANKIWVIK